MTVWESFLKKMGTRLSTSFPISPLYFSYVGMHFTNTIRTKTEIAKNLKKMGLSVAQIAEGTGLDIETIQSLSQEE